MASALKDPAEISAEPDPLVDSSQMGVPAAGQPHIATTQQAACVQHHDTSIPSSDHDQSPVDDDVAMIDIEDLDVYDDASDDPPAADSNDLLQSGWETWRGTRTDTPTAYDQTVARSAVRSESAQTCGESDFNSDDYEDYELPKRTLRPQHRTEHTYALPRFDNDSDDENYDPEDQPRRRHVRRKISHRPRNAGRYTRNTETGDLFRTSSGDEEMDLPVRTHNQEIDELKIILKFISEVGRNNFVMQASRLAGCHESDLKGYSLRHRRPAAVRSSSDVATLAVAQEDDLQHNLANHPSARGCYACAELHEHCSLLEDETSWPCDHCRADQNDCQLIIQPVRFKACEACKPRRKCSYTTTRNHGSACDHCAAKGKSCIAGPAKDHIKVRLRYLDEEEGGWTLPKKKLRSKYWTAPEECLECHDAGRQCHYLPDSDGHYRTGCVDCMSKSLPCTIRDKVSIPIVNAGDVVDQTPSFELEKMNHHKPQPTAKPPVPRRTVATRTVETSYSYPILFNCDNQPEEVAKPCLFCIAPDAAICGFGVRTIRVVDHKDGSKASELSRSKKPTYICTVCTTARMRIISCDRHYMQPIIGIYGDDAILERFHNKHEEMQNVEELAHYCSICPEMAVYECQTQDDDPTDTTAGCGLKLCETCAQNLEVKHKGSLQHTLWSLPARLPDGTLQLRADCELLRHDGPLSRYLAWLIR